MSDINTDFEQFIHRVGLRICMLRKSQRLTQEDLAEIANTNKNVISRIESLGQTNDTKISTFHAIAKALNVSVASLFDVDNENIFDDPYQK